MDLRHTCCTQWPDSKKTTRHSPLSSDLAVSWLPSLDRIAGSQQLLPQHLELRSKLKHIFAARMGQLSCGRHALAA